MDKRIEVEYIKYNQKNEVIELRMRKIVKKIGDGGHVSIPKELIGKEVFITFKEKKNEKKI